MGGMKDMDVVAHVDWGGMGVGGQIFVTNILKWGRGGRCSGSSYGNIGKCWRWRLVSF